MSSAVATGYQTIAEVNAALDKASSALQPLIDAHTLDADEIGITSGVLDTFSLNGKQYWCEVDEDITTITVTPAAAGTVGTARIFFHYKTAPHAVAVPSVNFPFKVSQAFTTSSDRIYVCDVSTVPGPAFGVLWITFAIGTVA